jgi:hypothetical protein
MDDQRIDREGIGNMRQAIALAAILIAAFCVYGFIASWEPGPHASYFRIGCPLLGILCGAVAAALLLAKRKNFKSHYLIDQCLLLTRSWRAFSCAVEWRA